MKRLAIVLITFVLCASLLVLASCSSKAFKPSGDGEIQVVEPTSSSGSSASGTADASATVAAYNFGFELLEDGTAYQIVDNGVYNGKTIVIPATYNGKPVTTIAPFAFKNCKSLESVTFSENLTEIPTSAFYSCTLLKEIKIVEGNVKYRCEGNCLIENPTNKIVLGCSTSVIPSSVTAIGEHAFYACANLRAVDIPATVTEISEKAYYKCTAIEVILVNAGNAVYKSKNSENVECNCLIEKATNKVLFTCRWSNIPSDVSSYGEYAFVNNTSVTVIRIPDGTTEISADMLANCTELDTIEIPASVTTISGFAFRECAKLKNIVIASENPVFKSENGCVIKKADNTLVLGGCTATIPNYVTAIGEMAFLGRGITSITIPTAVKQIGREAFYDCGLLTSVEFAVKTGWYVYYSPYADQEPQKLPLENDRFATGASAALVLSKSTSNIYHD